MKKLISLSLIFLITLNTFGFNLFFIFAVQTYRTENLEFIDEHQGTISAEKIVIFSLKRNNPHFLNSREIIYNNEMYDIVYKKTSINDTIFYCLNDNKDTKLHTAFSSLNDVGDNPASLPDHLAASVLKNLLKNYLPNPTNHISENYKSLRFYSNDKLSIQSVILKKMFPPPRPQIIS